MKLLNTIMCAFFLGGLIDLYAQTPVLNVEGGRIEGVVDEEGVTVYKGIPYAAPPVGELRWKHPQPVQPWQGVRNATALVQHLCKVKQRKERFIGRSFIRTAARK